MSYATSVIKSIQYGTVTLAAVASATATITSVNVAKAVLIYLGNSCGTSTVLYDAFTWITLTNSTTVTGTRSGTGNTNVVSFVVVEFY